MLYRKETISLGERDKGVLMNSERTQFGTLLKRYRTAAGLTQEALAARAQVSARTIADLERGISRTPRHDTLALLLEALSLTPQQQALLLATARPEVTGSPPRARSVSPPPLPPTALIGREQEMMRTMTFLQRDGVRLLTLTGPSGVGKTRLAIQLAQDLGEQFEDGVVFVALAPLRDPSLLPATLAQALGLRESSEGQVSEQIQAYVQEKQLLLVLDNFEQIRQAAPFIADLLATCPHLQILITSRAPLHVRGEQELAIAPLALEAAVALFRARAQEVRPEREYARPDVAAICEQVDCLPLAIELAAMHVKVLALPLLLERLSSRFTLLREGARDLPERQRTMQSAIAWSYDLLTAAQQRCFRALGVFLGGWTLDAAEAVCWKEGLLARDEVLIALAALIDHSLVSSESSVGGTPRFSMLEMLREYALSCLRATGEEEQTRRQHAICYVERAEKVGWPAQETQAVEFLQDFPNMRAALHWAAEQREIVLGLKLAVHFGPLLFIHGQTREASAWLEQMLSLDAGVGEQAAPLALRLTALYGAARFAMSRGRDEQATALAQEMLQLAERSSDHASQSLALSNLGVLAQARGENAQATAHFAESYTQARLSGDSRALGLARLNLAESARLQGDLERARVLLEEALSEARTTGFLWGVAGALTLLGHLAREQQDYLLARARYRESLGLYRRLRNPTYTAWCLEGMAALDCAEHHYERATQLCAAATVLRQKEQTPLPPAEQGPFDQTVMTARAALDEVAFSEAWAAGAALTQEEAITFALSSIAS
jgi:predicted ATPase/transcriptional regulator with XRE-family HTH domain